MNPADIGSIIKDVESQDRDAIHVPVCPVTAGEQLKPSQHVIIIDGKAYGSKSKTSAGIVDPFLQQNVIAGQSFWLLLKPGSIKNLIHDWTHPGFPKKDRPQNENINQWLTKMAIRKGCSVDELLELEPADMIETILNDDNPCRGCW